MRKLFALVVLLSVAPGWVLSLTPAETGRLQAADVVILGEIHDNPDHHANQARWLQLQGPSAVVFEMLTPAQAALVSPDLLSDDAALAAALDWSASGWPDFSMYSPVFKASRSTRIYGAAMPRSDLGQVMETGIAPAFGADASAYGLTAALPEDEQARREAFQHAAHCDALPPEMLPIMVDIQRLRDATLAMAILDAWHKTGGPVAVVTGNGHARIDWGIPGYLTRVAPDLSVFSVGQSEDGAITGPFDAVQSSPAVPRADPCLAFAASD